MPVVSASSQELMKETEDIRWWSSPRRLLREILQLDDTAHSIALGTTIGMFIGITPTVGIQMALVILFQLLFGRWIKFNRIAALITVYITNPLTSVPIYYFNYKVGTLFVSGSVTYAEFREILKYDSFSSWWDSVMTLMVDVGAPLVIGSTIVAGALSAATYPSMRWLIRRFRRDEHADGETVRQNLSEGNSEKAAEAKLTVDQSS